MFELGFVGQRIEPAFPLVAIDLRVSFGFRAFGQPVPDSLDLIGGEGGDRGRYRIDGGHQWLRRGTSFTKRRGEMI